MKYSERFKKQGDARRYGMTTKWKRTTQSGSGVIAPPTYRQQLARQKMGIA